MAWTDSIFQKFKDRAEKKKLEQEKFESMQREMEFQAKMQASAEQAEMNRQMALEKARQDFINGTGAKKLRAYDSIKNLQNPNRTQPSWMNKLSTYTQANKMKRIERRERNIEKLAIAKQMAKDRIMKRQQQRMERMAQMQIRRANRRPFGLK